MVALRMHEQGDFAGAGKLYLAALEDMKRSEPDGTCVAALLNNLGAASQGLGRFQDAESYFKRAHAALKSSQRADETLLVRVVNNLAGMYFDRQQFAKAERLGVRSLAARLDSLPVDAEDAATLHMVVGSLDMAQKRYVQAEESYRRALAIWEKVGPDRVGTMQLLNVMGLLYRRMGRKTEALACYNRALTVAETRLRPEHPMWVPILANAARVHEPPEAEAYYRRALAIAENSLGADHPLTGQVLIGYAGALREMKRKGEARNCEKRARAIALKSSPQDLGRHSIDAADLSNRH